MNRVFLFAVLISALLIFSSQPTLAQEPSYFTYDIDFEFNRIMGSDGEDYLATSDHDSDGNIYIASNIFYIVSEFKPWFYSGPLYDTSPNYLTYNVTSGAHDTSYNGFGDIVLTKLSPDGDILWSTYFGGNDKEEVLSIKVTPDDEIIMVGTTESENDFPLLNEKDYEVAEIASTFIAKFSTTGELLQSTFFGGTYLDSIHDILIDSEGNLILSGSTKSNDFPLVNAALDRIPVGEFNPTAFVTKMDSNLDIIFSTQMGGTDIDNDYTATLNNNDEIILMGITRSEDFPTTPDAQDTTHNGQLDAFYTKFSPDGEIIKSTFLGGQFVDWIESIVVDEDDNVFLTGYTLSNDFPAENAEDTTLNNGRGRNADAILVKINNDGNIIFATFFGGTNIDRGRYVLRSSDGYITMVGQTRSADFPIYGVINEEEMQLNNNAEYSSGESPTDIFVAKFAPDGRLAWSVIYGSSGMENVFSASLYNDDSLIITGNTFNNDDFPTTESYSSGYLFDGFVTHLELPRTILPPPSEHLGYKEVPGARQNEAVTFFDQLDMFSWGMVALVSSYIMILGIKKSGIISKLRGSRSDEYSESVRNYLEHLRDF